MEKLKCKKGQKAIILNLPSELRDGFQITFDESFDKSDYEFMLLFAQDSTQLKNSLPSPLPVQKDGLIWIAYPKKGSGISTDLSRNALAKVLEPIGYRPVSLISLNDVWSAMRYKPLTEVTSSTKAKTQLFEAVIESNDKAPGGAWVTMPFNVSEVFGTKGQVKVSATFDSVPYQGSLANMGTGGHILIITKEIRNKINKGAGDKVRVSITRDSAERVLEIPPELQKLLKTNQTAAQFYGSLSFTNRKEYAHWISSAKRAETREKRLRETLQRLSGGIKNPFAK